MKFKITFLLLAVVLASLSGCGFEDEITSSSVGTYYNDISVVSYDYSGGDFIRPGEESGCNDPSEFLGVTSDPTRIVGRCGDSMKNEEYEKLTKDMYVLYIFENEDNTASIYYKYYFFNNKEDYTTAYNAFCLSNGSPTIKNEENLFFAHGGPSALYVQGKPVYNDILIYLMGNNVEIITSWTAEEQSDDADVSLDNTVSITDEDVSA